MSPRDIAEKKITVGLPTLVACVFFLTSAGFTAATVIHHQTQAVAELRETIGGLDTKLDAVFLIDDAKTFARELAYRNPTIKVPDPAAIMRHESFIPTLGTAP